MICGSANAPDLGQLSSSFVTFVISPEIAISAYNIFVMFDASCSTEQLTARQAAAWHFEHRPADRTALAMETPM
jgi:hypothetical protein